MRAFGRAVAAAGLPLAYVTGRHLALALDGIAGAGLPWPGVLSCDVGTRLWVRTPDGGYAADPDFDAEMRRALGGVRLADVAEQLRHIACLRRQPAEQQGEFKLSYDVPAAQPAEAPDLVRAALAREGLTLQVVDSLDPVTGDGLLDVLPAGAGKHRTLAFLERRFGLDERGLVFAGDSGNDRDALLGPWLGILVGNAPAALAEELQRETARLGQAERLYVAAAPGVRGVLEGCRHFRFL